MIYQIKKTIAQNERKNTNKKINGVQGLYCQLSNGYPQNMNPKLTGLLKQMMTLKWIGKI